MTATTECQRPRRSKGFTIDSIIGTDSERNADDRAGSPKSDENFVKSTHLRTPQIQRHEPDNELERERESFRRERERTPEQTSLDHDRLRSKEVRNGLPSLDHLHRNASSIHRDIRDINFSSANIRDGIRVATSPEALKHFHEAFMHNAGGSPPAGAGLGVGMTALGHIEAQRHCRHPLSSLGMPGYPPHLPSPPQMHPMLMNRDLRQMYPYIADRYPSYFLPRYGMGSVPGLFFQPYRKPKRIRTAFSPSQLLQLEKSFEKSHYVVGQERKDLASELQLSETQVKVWFQNRRTKYKRTKSEQDGGTSHDETYPESPEESDISDNDDIDDVGDSSSYAHAYQNPIQTC